MSVQKSRYWALIIYPESLPNDWKNYLDESHLPIAVSPLHDSDLTLDGSGEFKKPHYHLLVAFPGPTSQTVADAAFSSLGGTRAVRVYDRSAYFRYLTHADSPDKAQYDIADVQLFGGFDPGEDVATLNDRAFARLRRLSGGSFRAVVDELVSDGVPLSWIMSNSHFLNLYIRS